jgi:N utilization substance protein B
MVLSPQKFREMVFQLLYSYDIGHPSEEVMVDLIMTELAISKKNVKVAQEKLHSIVDKLSTIDPLITSVSTSYDFERIQTVAKNILRLGVFELLFDDGIPPKVAISEAIRLARKFGTPESASFVNALLDHLYKQQRGEQTDSRLLEHKTHDLIRSEEINYQAFLESQQSLEKQDKEPKEE